MNGADNGDGTKNRGTVTRKFVTGTVGASPWRVKRTDRLPRFGATQSAKPVAGRGDAALANGHNRRQKSDGGTTSGAATIESKNARRKRQRGHKRSGRY